MKKVMIFGTFDFLHQGHLNLFKQAKELGDFLIAVIARDSTVKNVKKHNTMFNENQRLDAVKKFVNLAVLGNKDDKYKIIEEHRPDIICLGYDQKAFTETLEQELSKRNLKIKIIRLKPFKEHIFKSSKIKERLSK